MSEAFSLVDAAEHGDQSQAKRLAMLVAALRADPRVPEYDRYRLVARTSALDMIPAGKDRKARLVAYAELARKLMAEFPAQPDPYASLLAVAQDQTDMNATGQLAAELLASKAPAAVKTGARKLLERKAMVGAPLNFTAKDNASRPLTLTQFRGKVVVLYVWTSQVKGGASWVPRFVAQGDGQVIFIGLNFDPDQKTAQMQMAQLAPASIQVYDPAGPGGSVAASLRLARGPAIYLIDRKGVLQDVHGLDHFNEKLAQLLGATSS